jgi:hypothetical protein
MTKVTERRLTCKTLADNRQKKTEKGVETPSNGLETGAIAPTKGQRANQKRLKTPSNGSGTAENCSPGISSNDGKSCSDGVETAFVYSHLFTVANPDHVPSLCPCPIDNNWGIKKAPKRAKRAAHAAGFTNALAIATQPAYLRLFNKDTYCANTGELIDSEIVESDSDKRTQAQKIKALKAFDNAFLPLYKRRLVTLFFVTLTRSNRAKKTIAEMIKAMKRRLKNAGHPMLAYIWVCEVSPRKHWHYHLIFAVKRVTFVKGEKRPDWENFTSMWGSGDMAANCETVKCATGKYLSRTKTGLYMGKAQMYSMKGYRAFGRSSDKSIKQAIAMFAENCPKKGDK